MHIDTVTTSADKLFERTSEIFLLKDMYIVDQKWNWRTKHECIIMLIANVWNEWTLVLMSAGNELVLVSLMRVQCRWGKHMFTQRLPPQGTDCTSQKPWYLIQGGGHFSSCNCSIITLGDTWKCILGKGEILVTGHWQAVLVCKMSPFSPGFMEISVGRRCSCRDRWKFLSLFSMEKKVKV